MGTPKYDALSAEERKGLVATLSADQRNKDGLPTCYICEIVLDLAQPLDVDHILASDRGGEDSLNNWGLTHASCNRSKGNRDLQLLRYIARFRKARKDHHGGDETFSVGSALALHNGAKHETTARVEEPPGAGQLQAMSWQGTHEVVVRRFLSRSIQTTKQCAR